MRSSAAAAVLLPALVCGAVASAGTTPSVDVLPSPVALPGRHFVEEAQASFRREGCAWVTSRASWRVEVSSTGEISLRAFGPPAHSPPEEACAPSPRVAASDVFGLGTVALGRGEPSLLPPSAPAPGEGGALFIQRGPARERLRNTAEGLEQTWHFERAPEGEGDLRVRVQTFGLRHLATSARGHHFADPAGRGFLYGAATGVDAHGLRTPVPVAHREGLLELVVPNAVLAASAYPAVLDPLLSPEFALGPIGSTVSWTTAAPKIAPNPVTGGFLVGWDHLEAGNRTPRVARVELQGGALTVLDPGGVDPYAFPPSGEYFLEDLAVVNGEWVLAVRVNNGPGNFAAHACHFPVNKAPPLTCSIGSFSPGSSNTLAVRLASGASTKLAALTQRLSTSSVFQTRFVTSGAPTSGTGSGGTSEERVTAFTCDDLCVALAEVGNPADPQLDLLVLNPVNGGVTRVTVPFSHPGEVLRGGTLASLQHLGAQRVFGTYLASTSTTSTLYGFTFDPGTTPPTVTATAPHALSDTALGQLHAEPTVDSFSTAHNLVWRCGAGLCARKLDASGTAVGGVEHLAAGGSFEAPKVARTTGGLAVVAEEQVGGVVTLKATVFGATGQLAPWTPLVALPGQQANPAAAWDGQVFHAVWEEQDAALFRAVTARVASHGEVMDVVPLALTDAQQLRPGPAVASCGGQSLLVWTETETGPGPRGVKGLLVPLGGPAVPALSFDVSANEPGATQPAVGCLEGGTFLVAWVTQAQSGAVALGARRVEADGSVWPLLSTLPAGQAPQAPAVAGGAAGAVVVWGDGTQVVGAWVAPDGSVSGVGPSAPNPTFIGSGREGAPAVAFDGERFLVVWSRSSPGGTEVYGAELDASKVGSAQQLFTGAGFTQPRPVSVGSDWAVVAVDTAQDAHDVELRRVAKGTLGLVSGSLRQVTQGLNKEVEPHLSASDAGTVLVLYGREFETPAASARVYGVIGELGPEDAGTPDAGVDAGMPDAGTPDAGGGDAGVSPRQLTLTAAAQVAHGETSPGSLVRVTVTVGDPAAAHHGQLQLTFEESGLELADGSLAASGRVVTLAELLEGASLTFDAHLRGAPGEAASLRVVAREMDEGGAVITEAATPAVIVGGHEVSLGCGAGGAGLPGPGLVLLFGFAALWRRARRQSGSTVGC